MGALGRKVQIKRPELTQDKHCGHVLVTAGILAALRKSKANHVPMATNELPPRLWALPPSAAWGR